MTGLLCRALGPHALMPSGPLVVIPGGLLVTFECARCHTIRREKWGARYAYAGGRRYFHDKAYKEILAEYDRQGARAAWVSGAEKVQAPTTKEKADGRNAPRLRSVPGGKAQARRRTVHAAQRKRPKAARRA